MVSCGSWELQGGAQTEDTKEWRQKWWRIIIDNTLHGPYFWTGRGFGVNLAVEDGFASPQAERPLRSPHNSHLDVLARMGIIGLTIWIALWLAWFTTMIRARRRTSSHDLRFTRGLMGFAIAAVVAILVNAYFDPTLESPQVAMWLWSLFGLGLGLVARERLARERAGNLEEKSLRFS